MLSRCDSFDTKHGYRHDCRVGGSDQRIRIDHESRLEYEIAVRMHDGVTRSLLLPLGQLWFEKPRTRDRRRRSSGSTHAQDHRTWLSVHRWHLGG